MGKTAAPPPHVPGNRKVPTRMRKALFTLFAALAVLVGVQSPALAGSPHFVDDHSFATVDGATLTATFKEAGLGDEPQVHVVLSATAECVNPGGNKPSAANKQSVNAAGDFPTQNGRAEGTLSLTASFQPQCSPPMSVVFSNIVLTDETSGISIVL